MLRWVYGRVNPLETLLTPSPIDRPCDYAELHAPHHWRHPLTIVNHDGQVINRWYYCLGSAVLNWKAVSDES